MNIIVTWRCPPPPSIFRYPKDYCWRLPGLEPLLLLMKVHFDCIVTDWYISTVGTVQCHKINRTNLYEVKFVLDIHVCVFLTVYLLQARRKWEKLCLISGSLFAIVAMVWGLHLFCYDHKYFRVGYCFWCIPFSGNTPFDHPVWSFGSLTLSLQHIPWYYFKISWRLLPSISLHFTVSCHSVIRRRFCKSHIK